jgi:hypothetical protein
MRINACASTPSQCPGIDALAWTNFYRRERPELHLDADGAPAFLLNGVHVEYSGHQYPEHQYSFTLLQRVDSTLKSDYTDTIECILYSVYYE